MELPEKRQLRQMAHPERSREAQKKVLSASDVRLPQERTGDFAGKGRLPQDISQEGEHPQVSASDKAKSRVERTPDRGSDLAKARENSYDVGDLSRKEWQDLKREIEAIRNNYGGLEANHAKGEVGEAIARKIIEKEGLPGLGHVDAIVSGQHDGLHGVDLLAVKDGQLALVEVKYATDKATLPVGEMSRSWDRSRVRLLVQDPNKRLEAWTNPETKKALERLSPVLGSEEKRRELWARLHENRYVVVVSPRGREAVGETLVRQAKERGIPADHIISIRA